nr:hypothetical protein B21J21.190 [imported] - Neurospora crassa [Neurospora crassa]
MYRRFQHLNQVEDTQAQFIRTAFIEGRATQHHQFPRIPPEYMQSPAVSSRLLNSMHLPLVRVPTKTVGIDLAPISVRDHDGAVRPASRRPDHIRRGIRRELPVNDYGDPRSRVKLCRLVGDVVVDRVVDAVELEFPTGNSCTRIHLLMVSILATTVIPGRARYSSYRTSLTTGPQVRRSLDR